MAITYKNVCNPRYADADNKSINVEVTFEGLPEFPGIEPTNGCEVTFCATPTDTEAHGREIHKQVMSGACGKIADYVAPPPPPPSRLDRIEAALAAAGIKIP